MMLFSISSKATSKSKACPGLFLYSSMRFLTCSFCHSGTSIVSSSISWYLLFKWFHSEIGIKTPVVLHYCQKYIEGSSLKVLFVILFRSFQKGYFKDNIYKIQTNISANHVTIAARPPGRLDWRRVLLVLCITLKRSYL